MNGVGITYLWLGKKFPPFIRLEGRRGDYEVYKLERTCKFIPFSCDEEKPIYEQEGNCSECHDLMYGTDNYCHECGAKVVE